MFPIIVSNKIRFLPYLSDSAPILGETSHCKVLDTELVKNSASHAFGRDIREERSHEAT